MIILTSIMSRDVFPSLLISGAQHLKSTFSQCKRHFYYDVMKESFMETDSKITLLGLLQTFSKHLIFLSCSYDTFRSCYVRKRSQDPGSTVMSERTSDSWL